MQPRILPLLAAVCGFLAIAFGAFGAHGMADPQAKAWAQTGTAYLLPHVVAVFALLYVPFVLASGIGVLGYLPGYLSEEGYVTGTRFILVSLVVPGPAATVVSGILIAALAGLVWWKSNPDDPWLAQVVMIGGTLAIVSPRYPWYALLLVPMIAMSGRWEWLAIPLALTERLLWGNIAIARGVMAAAIVFVAVMTWQRYRKSNRTITVENNSNLSSEGRRTQINTNRVPRPQTKE